MHTPAYANDSFRCEDAHENGRDQPEWQHAVRDIQQRIADREWGRIHRHEEQGTWVFLPRFEVGETYTRSNLHDRYGGMRQSGIAPTRDFPIVFLFSGSSGESHGYEDEFLDDGRVIYTGEGREGRMTFERGNKAIRDHIDNNRELHLFEYVDQGVVEYRGQYECADWFREDLPDTNGEIRSAIRFELTPIQSGTIDGRDLPANREPSLPSGDESDSEDGIDLPEGRETTVRRERVQNRVLRDEALVREIKQMYDDRCQICGDKHLQGQEIGYSEVHHLMPLGADGPDVPANVVVVCPNHHTDFETGMLSIDPESLQISHQYENDVDGRELLIEEGHDIGPEYIAYHNQVRTPSD